MNFYSLHKSSVNNGRIHFSLNKEQNAKKCLPVTDMQPAQQRSCANCLTKTAMTIVRIVFFLLHNINFTRCPCPYIFFGASEVKEQCFHFCIYIFKK